MARQHGIQSGTYKRFVIDSGQVRMGYVSAANPGVLLGATRDGSTFTIETEYREMPVDGAKGPVKGGRRITKVTARLVANFVEWSTDLMKIMLPGSSESYASEYDTITRSLQLSDSDYLSNVVIIGEVSDTDATGPAVLMIKNALADGNVENTFTDADEAVNKVQFTGHFTESDLDTEPWLIIWPHDSNPTTTTTAGG